MDNFFRLDVPIGSLSRKSYGRKLFFDSVEQARFGLQLEKALFDSRIRVYKNWPKVTEKGFGGGMWQGGEVQAGLRYK